MPEQKIEGTIATTPNEVINPISKNIPLETASIDRLDPIYKERLKDLVKTWEQLLVKHPELLQFGPNYLVILPDGKTQELITFYYDNTDKDQELRRLINIVALDQDGNPIADRYTKIRLLSYKDCRYAKADGMIATGIRGAGLSSTTELVNLDVLQREANRLGDFGYPDLTWHITNANGEALHNLEEEFETAHDQTLLPKLEAARLEQQRWQSVYGPQGWLGFNNSAEKKFLSNPLAKRLDSSSQVTLQRVNDKLVVVNDLPLTDKENHRLTQLDRLRVVIDRIKELTKPK